MRRPANGRHVYDAPLTSAALGVFVRTVFASPRGRARKQWCVARGQCGAVTFVQRFGDALNLNVHFHSLLLDGVFAPRPDGPLRLHTLPPPEDAEIERVVGQVARRIARLLERRGLGPEADLAEADPLAEDQPLLAQLYGASVAGRILPAIYSGELVARLSQDGRVRVGRCLGSLDLRREPAPEDRLPPDRMRCLGCDGVMPQHDGGLCYACALGMDRADFPTKLQRHALAIRAEAGSAGRRGMRLDAIRAMAAREQRNTDRA